MAVGPRAATVLLASRINMTRAIYTLAERLETRPRVLVTASAVGFYGDRPDGAELDETAPPQPGQFQSDLCAAGRARPRRCGRSACAW